MKVENTILVGGAMHTEIIQDEPTLRKKNYPYTVEEAIQRLSPQFRAVSTVLDALPNEACPFDIASMTVTLCPTFFTPFALLEKLELESIGNWNAMITPPKKESSKQVQTIEVHIAGKRSSIRAIPPLLETFKHNRNVDQELGLVEHIAVHDPIHYLVRELNSSDENIFSITLSCPSTVSKQDILTLFLSYAKSLSVTCHQEWANSTGMCWYIPVKGTVAQIQKLSTFSLIRRIRPAASMRPFSH